MLCTIDLFAIIIKHEYLTGPAIIKAFKKNQRRYPLSLTVHLINPDRHLDDLVAIEQACFPKAMQDSRQKLESFFREPLSSGLLLCKNGQAIGYMAGIHICEENSGDMLATSAFLREAEEITFYLTNIAICPEHRSILTLEFLGHEMATLLKSIDYRYVVAHVRKKTGLSRIAQRTYGAVLLKAYDNWQDYDEPFDYIMFDLEKVPTLPAAIDYTLSAIRRWRSRIKHLPWRD